MSKCRPVRYNRQSVPKILRGHPNFTDRAGFTLLELVIALGITAIVSAGIYAAFISQQASHTEQQQIVDIQQNLRGLLCIIERDLRLAGHNPSGVPGIGIQTARPNTFRYTLDIHDGADNDSDGLTDEPDENYLVDGDADDFDEDITFGFLAADDADDNGIADAGAAPIYRTATGSGRIAESIEAIAFAFAFDDNKDGELDYIDTNGNGSFDNEETIWAYDTGNPTDGTLDTNNATGAALATSIDYDRIRGVRVWILARSESPIGSKSNTQSYTVGNQVIVTNDRYRRQLQTATIKFRNMGL